MEIYIHSPRQNPPALQATKNTTWRHFKNFPIVGPTLIEWDKWYSLSFSLLFLDFGEAVFVLLNTRKSGSRFDVLRTFAPIATAHFFRAFFRAVREKLQMYRILCSRATEVFFLILICIVFQGLFHLRKSHQLQKFV